MSMPESDEHPNVIIQYSPYRPPRVGYGEGRWVVEKTHFDKGYPLEWRWVPGSIPEVPVKPRSTEVTRTESDPVIVPLGEELHLHKPRDIGVQRWQEDD